MNLPTFPTSKTDPFFSIIILFWNNEQYIRKCLTSLLNQTWKDFEIIFIDNGSDQPLSFDINIEFPTLKIITLKLHENIGFAAGNNFGAEHASGKFLTMLNADAFPQQNWLEIVSSAIEKYPDCFFASKLVMADDPTKLDGTGDVYHFTGLVWRKNHNYIEKHVNLEECEVFSACGAAAIYPKIAFEEVNGYDTDFFSYVEDVDLGFRLRLIGYKCIFLPDAIVHHVGSGSTGIRSDFSVYYGQRNLVWTFFKNMPGILFWLLLPVHIFTNLLIIIFSFFRKQGKVTVKAKFDAIVNLPIYFRKRKNVQLSRNVSIISILQSMDWSLVSPMMKILRDNTSKYI
jgi:GT2 family glycosyltransferase